MATLQAHWRVRARFAFWLGVIVAVGVVLRVLCTVLLAPWPPPTIRADQWFFHYEAIYLAQGRGFIDVLAALHGRTMPTATHPPLYPFVLAGLAKLGGTGELTQRLAGSVFGMGTIAALGVLGRRVGGERVGLLAAGIAAIYPMLISADSALSSETLDGLLIALSLVAAYRLLDAPRTARAVCLGVLLGLATLTRGEGLLLIPLLLWPVARRPEGRRAALIAVCAAVVVIAPWVVRNWVVLHEPVVSTDLQSTIEGANCPTTYYGSQIGSWNFACTEEGAPTVDVIRFAVRHIGRLPLVLAARLALVWGLRGNGLTDGLPYLPGRSATEVGLGFAMYDLLVPLAVYGFVLLRRRAVPVLVLMSTFVLVTSTSLLFYGTARLREPAELSLVVLAAVAVDQLWRRHTRAAPREAQV